MILLTLSRGKGEETVRLQLPASPAEIGETFAFLDRISLDTTATAILDVSSNVLRIDEEKPEMHISVQGYKVTLCFAEKENPEVAVLVKQALLSAYAMPQK